MKEKYIIVSPCFNEEKIIEAFLHSVENILAHSGIYFTIIMVDDASTDSTLEKLKEFKFSSDFLELKVIRSSINSGHQEAIRLGLKYAWKYLSDVKGVIVMDSDGEDDPAVSTPATPSHPSKFLSINCGSRFLS